MKKVVSLSLLFAFFILSLIIHPKKTEASCFSFIPYGYNGEFSHLPLGKEFCYFFGGDVISAKTNSYGGRFISKQGLPRIFAFGESQLLGMDWTDNPNDSQHDLVKIFGSATLVAFAAPNNGPLQAIRQFDRVSKVGGLSDEKIFFGFNFGTDIFRINPSWDPNRFIPLSSEDLRRIFQIPFLHDTLLAIARVRGKHFGSSVSNAKAVRAEYFSKPLETRLSHLNSWLQIISNTISNKKHDVGVIIFPPYWYIGSEGVERNRIEHDYRKVICSIYKKGLFSKIVAADLTDTPSDMAYDGRHFKMGKLDFQRINRCN